MQLVHAIEVSLCHLALEDRLLSTRQVGGKAYVVTHDDVITYGDLYLLLSTLAMTKVSIPKLQPLVVVLLAHVTEAYVLLRARYLGWLPPVTGDLQMLQPATIATCTAHFWYDSTLTEKDLGYRSPMSALEGLCMTLNDWNKNARVEMKGAETGAAKLAAQSSLRSDEVK